MVLGGILFFIIFFLAQDIKYEYLILESTQGQEGTCIFGRLFVTVGWTVVQVTVAVAIVDF